MKKKLLDYKKFRIFMFKGIRVNSVKREPSTVKWIESMNNGEVLYDIGCNIGAFSLIAAKNKNIVYAFDPSAVAFSILMKNIIDNKCQNKVFASNICLYSEEKIDFFYYNHLKKGKAGHSFSNTVDHRGNQFLSPFKQLSFSTTVDLLVSKYNLPVPNFIKIDVDGKEFDILKGAKNVLLLDQCRSILIEYNDERIDRILTECNFNCVFSSKNNKIYNKNYAN